MAKWIIVKKILLISGLALCFCGCPIADKCHQSDLDCKGNLKLFDSTLQAIKLKADAQFEKLSRADTTNCKFASNDSIYQSILNNIATLKAKAVNAPSNSDLLHQVDNLSSSFSNMRKIHSFHTNDCYDTASLRSDRIGISSQFDAITKTEKEKSK